MPDKRAINYGKLDEFSLDPRNPRLGRRRVDKKLSQADVLGIMRDWTLDELAVSFLESGFWPHEALIVTRERLNGKSGLVVLEGNRRLAALMYLRDAIQGRDAVKGKPATKKWKEIAESSRAPRDLFKAIPYNLVSSRRELDAFLGFRHVTGIKEWKPAEKAQYIARLIEDRRMTYEQVRRKIGSKTPTVNQHYISYRLLLQMEEEEDISLERVEKKFSVLYLSLRTSGVRKYLHIDIKATERKARRPVPRTHLKALANFALWLFGNEETSPIVVDSRQVDDFGTILESKKAVEYLERSERPSFDVAFKLAGADEPELLKLVNKAADDVELALGGAHRHVRSSKLKSAVERLISDSAQLARLFPDIAKKYLKN